MASKPQLAQRRPQISRMNIPAPAAAQQSLKSRQRESLLLKFEGDSRQQPGPPFFGRGKAFAGGIHFGELRFSTLCFNRCNLGLQARNISSPPISAALLLPRKCLCERPVRQSMKVGAIC